MRNGVKVKPSDTLGWQMLCKKGLNIHVRSIAMQCEMETTLFFIFFFKEPASYVCRVLLQKVELINGISEV